MKTEDEFSSEESEDELNTRAGSGERTDVDHVRRHLPPPPFPFARRGVAQSGRTRGAGVGTSDDRVAMAHTPPTCGGRVRALPHRRRRGATLAAGVAPLLDERTRGRLPPPPPDDDDDEEEEEQCPTTTPPPRHTRRRGPG